MCSSRQHFQAPQGCGAPWRPTGYSASSAVRSMRIFGRLRRAMDIILQCRGDAADHRIPAARFVLPELPHTRIPRTVITVEQPAPARVVSIEQPQRLPKRAGKVRDRRIDRNDEVEIVDQRRGVGKVVKVAAPVDDAMAQRAAPQLRDRVLAFLQAHELAFGYVEQRCEYVESDAA